MPKPSLDSLARLLWALVLVTLPLTSFRYVPFMGEGTTVRPLALYPLVLLWPVLLIRLKQGTPALAGGARGIARPWPGALTILLAFVLAVLAATTMGAALSPLELRGVDYSERALRALLTLAIGLAFFIAAVWMNQSEDDLKFSVKWLLVGLAFDLAWGAIQFVGLNSGHRPELVKIQNLFSVRGLVQNKRVSGFAYEPSWLAGQIATLYLPWLFASLLSRYRLTRFRWLEPLLLLAALAGVLMTYSRSGLFVVSAAALFTFIVAGRQALSAFRAWVWAGFDRHTVRSAERSSPASLRERWTRSLGAVQAAGSRILLALLVVASLAGAVAFLADKDYIATFFKSQKEDLFAYAVDVYLGPRLAYSVAALEAFQQLPWMGVGLGASGFSIYNHMPDWVMAGVPEIAEQLSPDSHLYPNPKNLYVRLLAETGLAGFVLFAAFWLALLAEALGLLRQTAQGARWLGTAALFTIVALALQGLSQDSFAMPELWVNLGLLAGAAGFWEKVPVSKESV